MRYLLFSILFASCVPKEDKMHRSIKGYLMKRLNDASSYESVEFSKPDTLFTSFYFTKKYFELKDTIEFYKQLQSEETGILKTNYTDKILRYYDSLFYLDGKYKPEPFGWRISHTYRAKNALGAKVIGTDTFYLNSRLEVMDLDTLRLDK